MSIWYVMSSGRQKAKNGKKVWYVHTYGMSKIWYVQNMVCPLTWLKGSARSHQFIFVNLVVHPKISLVAEPSPSDKELTIKTWFMIILCEKLWTYHIGKIYVMSSVWYVQNMVCPGYGMSNFFQDPKIWFAPLYQARKNMKIQKKKFFSWTYHILDIP